MNVTCPECATTYRVDPLKVPAGGVRARCANCPAEFLVSVDSVVPAFAAEVATGVKSGGLAAEEDTAYDRDSSAFGAEPPTFGDDDAVETTTDTADVDTVDTDTVGIDVSRGAPDPDAPVDTFADSFSAYHAEDEAGEEETAAVGVGNSDLSRGRVAAYFDAEGAEEETGAEDETVVAIESSDAEEPFSDEADEGADEIGIAVTVEEASSWNASEPDPDEAGIAEPSDEGDADTTVAASDDASAEWTARTTGEDASDQTEPGTEAAPAFDSSSVFTRDTFAPVVPVATDEYVADDTFTQHDDENEVVAAVEDDDLDAETEGDPVAARVDDRDENVDAGTSGNDTSAGGWEDSAPTGEGTEKEYGESATLEEVEAPAGFAAVQQSRSDADLSLPPAPFGSADPNARARSLARALVSDIVVYHRDRRDRSIRAGTLRQEFREEIRKSWDEYVSHVGNQVARDTSYFRDALNEVLAGGQQLF